ncbi:MAG: hypothetical protein ACI4OP_06125 [Candidatus Coprovivens sp.]
MSKSIRLNDNTYLDSSGVTHNRALLSTILESKIIYDSGSNSNGSYIRYTDGTMICAGQRSWTISNNTKVGSVYYTDAVQYGSFPISFSETPIVVFHTAVGSLNPIEHNSISKTSLGYGWLWNPTQRTNVYSVVNYIAFGKWK